MDCLGSAVPQLLSCDAETEWKLTEMQGALQALQENAMELFMTSHNLECFSTTLLLYNGLCDFLSP